MPPQKSRVAVDLSGSLLRVVEGVLAGPLRSGSGPTPAGSLVGGKILDASAVAGALHQLLARTEVQETKALIAVSDALATFRVLRFSTSASDNAIESAVVREFPLNPERIETRWVEIDRGDQVRTVFATAWDRGLVGAAVEAVRGAGLEPAVVELKSLCVTRTVRDACCIVVDMSANPAEVFIIDDHLPQLWHSFELTVQLGEDITAALVPPLRSVIRFFERRRDTSFSAHTPVLIAGDQMLPGHLLGYLTQVVGHPVQQLAPPPRVPEDLRHGTYLTCLGMLMRRG